MMEESRGQLKNRLARIFRSPALLLSSATSSSATGASSRSLSAIASDIAHEPVFIPRRRASEADELHLAVLRRSLSLDGRRTRQLGSGSGSCGCCTSASHKRKDGGVKEKTKLFDAGEGQGRTCPPSSPSFHMYSHCFKVEETSTTKKKKKKKEKAKKKQRIRSRYELSITSSSDEDGSGFFSSDEAETIFCSRSFSSDSSEFYRRPSPKTKSKNNTKEKKKKKKQKKPKFCSQPQASVPFSETEQRYGDGFAVLKRSTDPYRDFRNSMVEMIVERQIFGACELERLLHCYLSLNSPENHSAILRSFADVSQVLFSY
ncbi:hypothetical protein HPP92_002907 [Vanilla planifolia]|uniref:Transcription repressor n=1 Tax=Vanilla planifolia TaxID=51239 RepID=A0A835RTV6_VANPL|nr:hypothetical protein HPP92_002907 [Vanilla planifolia]